jgi:hypothetical protein
MKASIGAQSENPMLYVFKLMRLRWVIFMGSSVRTLPALTIALWLLTLAVLSGRTLSTYTKQPKSPLIIERDQQQYSSKQSAFLIAGFPINPDGQFQAAAAGIISG